MGLLSETLRHLLASDPVERRASLAPLVGRMFGVEPVKVGHRSLSSERPFDLVHFPKSGTRPWAVTLTLGLGEIQGRELCAVTLADVRAPEDDRIAWMLGSAVGIPLGGVGTLPPGCLGRSSHRRVLVASPWVFSPQSRPDYERIVGARLDLAIPITDREAALVEARGASALIEAMQAQAIAPCADRPAGETLLPE